MTAQLEIESVVMQGVDQTMEFYAGYSFGWASCSWPIRRFISGVVVTPRYAARCSREVDPDIPLILDNGAFPAWAKGDELTFFDQIHHLERAIDEVGESRVRFVVWPDVVGSPNRTMRRLVDTFRAFAFKSLPALIPVQEGAYVEEVCSLAAHRGGLFVGGKTRQWKMAVLEQARRFSPNLHIHIGRISSSGHLHRAAAGRATSFDTTTFLRQMGSNRFTDYRPRLERYATPRAYTRREMQQACYYE